MHIFTIAQNSPWKTSTDNIKALRCYKIIEHNKKYDITICGGPFTKIIYQKAFVIWSRILYWRVNVFSRSRVNHRNTIREKWIWELINSRALGFKSTSQIRLTYANDDDNFMEFFSSTELGIRMLITFFWWIGDNFLQQLQISSCQDWISRILYNTQPEPTIMLCY